LREPFDPAVRLFPCTANRAQTEAIMATLATKQVLEKTAQQTVRLALRTLLKE
jgi:hypothetical protein